MVQEFLHLRIALEQELAIFAQDIERKAIQKIRVSS
jgi:hypothetical protein